MNMLLVVGSNGKSQNNNKTGTMCLEFKFNNHQLINSQVIELFQLGLENLRVEFSTYQHTHLQIWRELAMQMLLKTFHIKIDIRSGSLFILDIQDHKRRQLLKFNGRIHKINKNMKILSTSRFQNTLYMLERTSISQDLVEKWHQLHLMLVKVPLNQTMILEEKVIHSILLLERRSLLEFNQRLTQKRILISRRNHTKFLMMQLLIVSQDQVQVKRISQ